MSWLSAKKTKVFEGKSVLKKLVLSFILCISMPQAWADSDCLIDDIADCVFGGQYNLKLKRLYDIDMGQWSGQGVVNGSTPPATDGRRFCILAYEDLSSGRNIGNYKIEITGPKEGSSFVLSQNSHLLPVTLRVTGKRPANENIKNHSFADGSVEVTGNNSRTACRDYEFSLSAEVSREDVLQRMAVGNYTGTFTLWADSDLPIRRVRENFVVTLSIIPVYQVSKLKDVELDSTDTSSDGIWLYDDMGFCVFSMGGRDYKMTLNSQLRPSEPFELRNSLGQGIPYRADVQLNDGSWKIFTSSGTTDSGSMTGSGVLDCGGATNALIRIGVQTADTNGKRSGGYKDIVVVTVGPE